MKTEWTDELCSKIPEQFEQLNPDTYIQRRNIRKNQTKEDEANNFESYICESRMISTDVYNEFMEAMESPSQLQIINNFQTVTENQQISDSNTLTIMSAIADLYEMIAGLS